MEEATDSVAGRVEAGFKFCFGRGPTAKELGVMLGFVARERAAVDDGRVWASVARVLMNTDEFVTRE